jgi:hypothetical protein
MMTDDLQGLVPESWNCVDCGIDTAPGCHNRAQMERAFAAIGDDQGVEQTFDQRSEVYTVRSAVWQKTGLGPMAGCLCIGCLEKRIGRALRPKDFQRGHPLNTLPGTLRLLQRRGKRR